MTPPPTAALGLLGAWALVIFWVTAAGAIAQARDDDRLDSLVPDERLDGLDDSPSGRATERSFPTADD
ncbi:hypothetical protein [Haloterrigena salinisoli]|uniref:hypothetical protein n=1 Tax=Haloterrigena salinisoli TaxID=3132747 RepID=UPI0030CD3E92